MNSTETRQKLLKSDEFVFSEVQKLQTFYHLKREIRYGHSREDKNHTESVAEHIFAIHCLIDYFLPLEDPDGKWNKLKIHEMAQYHDIDEIETGDIVSYKKTASDYANEVEAREKVIARLPESTQSNINEIVKEFEAQSTIEAKFVKALDKFEPMIHCFSETGRKTLHENKFTVERRYQFTGDHIKPFPILNRFEETLNSHFIKEKYYYSES